MGHTAIFLRRMPVVQNRSFVLSFLKRNNAHKISLKVKGSKNNILRKVEIYLLGTIKSQNHGYNIIR